MWLLPQGSFTITLWPGVYFVPWHVKEEELRALAVMVARGTKVGAVLPMNEGKLAAAVDQGFTFPDTLVVLDVQSAEGRVEETAALARGLRAPFVLLKWPEPLPEGYGWLERFVKAPLLRALLHWASSADHPLASLHIERLPVVEAAALTTNPIELLSLLEATVDHRLSNARHGTSERAYVQSLYVAAGEKIFKKLPRDIWAPTAELLERAGLVQRVLGDLRSGPLIRATRDLRVAGAWARAMPGDMDIDGLSIRDFASLAEMALPREVDVRVLQGVLEALPAPLRGIEDVILDEHIELLTRGMEALRAPEHAKMLGSLVTRFHGFADDSGLRVNLLSGARTATDSAASEALANPHEVAAIDALFRLFGERTFWAAEVQRKRFHEEITHLIQIAFNEEKATLNNLRAVTILLWAARSLTEWLSSADLAIIIKTLDELCATLDATQDRLRAQTLFLLSGTRQLSGDTEGAERDRRQALGLAPDIETPGHLAAQLFSMFAGRTVLDVGQQLGAREWEGVIWEPAFFIALMLMALVVEPTCSWAPPPTSRPHYFLWAHVPEAFVEVFVRLRSFERPTVFDLGRLTRYFGADRMRDTRLPDAWRAFAHLLIASLLAALADPDGVLDHAPEALTICEAHASEAWADKGAALASTLAADARAALA